MLPTIRRVWRADQHCEPRPANRGANYGDAAPNVAESARRLCAVSLWRRRNKGRAQLDSSRLEGCPLVLSLFCKRGAQSRYELVSAHHRPATLARRTQARILPAGDMGV